MHGAGYRKISDLDERDCRIVQKRMGAFLALEGPQVGDYVKFADGIERRISYMWQAEDGLRCQTSDGGSWYLGDGYCSFSGSLHPAVPGSSLKLVGVIRRGSCWFFHHDWQMAHNGVDVELPMFNEWHCSLEAPR
jgi:hypothetical protein